MHSAQRDSQLVQRLQAEHRALSAKLAHIGFIWGGSVHSQRMTCGRPDCACHSDPEARHGPYVYWTTKVAGRSVSQLLHPPEAELLSQWVENRRELDRIVRQMKSLSHRALKVFLRLRRSK